MDLKALWEYMQADIAADHFAEEMKNSENRKKLLDHRNFLMEQQNNMKKIESDISAMQDRLEAVRDEAERLEALLNTTAEQLESDPPADSAEAARRITALRKLSETLTHYQAEMQKMHKDAETRDRQQKDIRIRAAKAKQEYDQIKAVYDTEFARDSARLKELKAKAEEQAGRQDPQLLARYRQIKQHATPPMTRISGGQCCGCFMQQPSATLRKIEAGDAIVECDSCGRIFYLGD